VPGLLLLYGIAGAIGLVLAGVFGARYPVKSVAFFIAVTALSVLAIWLWPTAIVLYVGMLLTWGIAFGALPALLQTRMMHVASLRIRDLAAAIQTTAFNFGIGVGALIGAVLIVPLGVDGLPLVSTVLIGTALVVFAVLSRRPRFPPLP